MARWILWIVTGLLATGQPAAAHDMSAADLARLNAQIEWAINSGWVGMLAVLASGMALGALHGLEPGHSKTMMSAFIIAIRGTVRQAILLGASATVSHTAVVWLLVVPVMLWGGTVDLAGNEAYFEIASAAAVLTVGGWTLIRVLRSGGRLQHDHDPPTEGEMNESATSVPQPAVVTEDGVAGPVIDTGHGLARLDIATFGGAAHFVVRGVARSGRSIPFHKDVMVETRRRDGSLEEFDFTEHDGMQVSRIPVPAPHSFVATLRIAHGDHGHVFPVVFALPGETPMATALKHEAYQDQHERAHAEEIKRRLASGRPLTTWQIVLFGLSGGLLPCPAAITVLLLCLQLKRLGLGLLLVSSFSLGLALTMIAAGMAAALGVRHLGRRFQGFDSLARLATYISCALIMGIGVYMLTEGLVALA